MEDHTRPSGTRPPDTSPSPSTGTPSPATGTVTPPEPVSQRGNNNYDVDGDGKYQDRDFKAGNKGSVYQKIIARGWADDLIYRRMTQTEVAKKLKVTQGAVSRAVKALREDKFQSQAAAEFEERNRKEQEKSGFGFRIDIWNMDDDELWELVDFFADWRTRHFRDLRAQPYTTPPHQRKWLWLILRAIRDGRLLLILSPPRHGKTELLIHIDIFLLTRVSPNLRMVKVCKSEGLAKKAVGSALDHLSANDSLIEESLPDGSEFKPTHGSRRPWNSLEMTVATRDIAGLKSPSLAAVGAGGTLLSRDGDVFTLDDIEDHHTTRTPDARQGTREWMANDLMSRKEASTAIVAIGSRQHPDDIWGHLIDNPQWDVVIEQAHDDAVCQVEDGDDPANWDKHHDCMLWPEVRDYEWLMGVKNDPERRESFAMTYQNEPQDADTATFTIDTIEICKDLERITGHYPREWIADGEIHRTRLIAGLDPSDVGHQAVFLWAYDPPGDTLYAVDFENKRGGGIGRARQQIQDWFERYGVVTWVIESNLYRGGIQADELLHTFCQMNHIQLLDHETQGNKWDETLGVTALAKPMRDGRVSIPWGDIATQNHWEQYRRQLINFSRDRMVRNRGRKKGISDLVMASWFPWETIKRWRREYLEEVSRVNMDSQEPYPFTPAHTLYNNVFPSVFSRTFTGVGS